MHAATSFPHHSDNPSGDIPLVFTFFAENVEDDTTVTIPDPTDPVEPTVVPVVIPDVVAMFNVAEIERIIEEDVMLAAEDLGLNVTVEDFVRFGRSQIMLSLSPFLLYTLSLSLSLSLLFRHVFLCSSSFSLA